jgi:hypothetical protein
MNVGQGHPFAGAGTGKPPGRCPVNGPNRGIG